VAVWKKVVGGPTKGRIYGFGLEGSIIGGQTDPAIVSQVPCHVPNTNEDSLDQTEMIMHQEADKLEMQKEIQELKTLVHLLLAKNGMTPPTSNDPSVSGSN